jgi:AraC-like DNA-binding protein
LQKLRSPDPVLDDALWLKAEGGSSGRAQGREIAAGPGWRVVEVVCTHGPGDASFEECFDHGAVSMVMAGTFAYRTAGGTALMVPGSVMLGRVGQCYECDHHHGEGDRCVSFQFSPELEAEAMSAAGARTGAVPSIGPDRGFSAFFARARAGLGNAPVDWESLAFEAAGAAAAIGAGAPTVASPVAERRVSDVAREIEAAFDRPWPLTDLAALAGMSPFHFLRTYRGMTGVTPHQHVLRLRLQAAAALMLTSRRPVTEIAYEVGFEDLSNFNRSFRNEFGQSPSRLRAMG